MKTHRNLQGKHIEGLPHQAGGEHHDFLGWREAGDDGEAAANNDEEQHKHLLVRPSQNTLDSCRCWVTDRRRRNREGRERRTGGKGITVNNDKRKHTQISSLVPSHRLAGALEVTSDARQRAQEEGSQEGAAGSDWKEYTNTSWVSPFQ